MIEFKDSSFRDGKWIIHENLQVGRIDSIIKNIGPLRDHDHEFELWLEYYCEVPGRIYVAPELVVRLIEQGNLEFPKNLTPPIPIGTNVIHDGSGKRALDKIDGYEIIFDAEETQWRFSMKYSGYTMCADEFTVEK